MLDERAVIEAMWGAERHRQDGELIELRQELAARQTALTTPTPPAIVRMSIGEREVVRAMDAARLTGMDDKHFWTLIKKGEVQSVLVGHARYVYLDSLPQYQWTHAGMS